MLGANRKLNGDRFGSKSGAYENSSRMLMREATSSGIREANFEMRFPANFLTAKFAARFHHEFHGRKLHPFRKYPATPGTGTQFL